jgi:hypothetical protein
MLALSLLLALVIGVAPVHRADAQVFRPRESLDSMRLDAKGECKSGGGTQFQTVYHYNSAGSVQSLTTTCTGGSNNGETCTITYQGRNCIS